MSSSIRVIAGWPRLPVGKGLSQIPRSAKHQGSPRREDGPLLVPAALELEVAALVFEHRLGRGVAPCCEVGREHAAHSAARPGVPGLGHGSELDGEAGGRVARDSEGPAGWCAGSRPAKVRHARPPPRRARRSRWYGASCRCRPRRWRRTPCTPPRCRGDTRQGCPRPRNRAPPPRPAPPRGPARWGAPPCGPGTGRAVRPGPTARCRRSRPRASRCRSRAPRSGKRKPKVGADDRRRPARAPEIRHVALHDSARRAIPSPIRAVGETCPGWTSGRGSRPPPEGPRIGSRCRIPPPWR